MSQIDRTSEHPPFRQIADDLHEAIERGQFGPGDKIPSARRLADSYQVTLSTAQRALTELRVAGLVVAARGIGTVVRQRPLGRRERWQPAAPPLSRLRSVKARPASGSRCCLELTLTPRSLSVTA